MHTVKMKCNPDEYQRQSQNKPDGMILKRDYIHIAIAHGPKHQHLKCRPDQHPADQRITHIIQKLIVKQKPTALGHKGRNIFQLGALLLPGKEIVMQNASNPQQDQKIPKPNAANP